MEQRSMLPLTVPYDANGDYIRLPNGDINIINPIRELDYNTNQRRTFRANASMYSQIDFGKNMGTVGRLELSHPIWSLNSNFTH